MHRLDGAQVEKVSLTRQLASGSHQISIPYGTLGSGVYMIRVVGENFVESARWCHTGR
jgi:hypothetical protein